MAHDNDKINIEKERFKNIQEKPWELSKDTKKSVYKLQKMFYGNRFSKIKFKKCDLKALCFVLVRFKLFRQEYLRALKDWRGEEK